MENYKLNNGHMIPAIGFGTWQMEEGPEAQLSVQEAIEAGYRHIDTAAAYGNEKSVGLAVATSNVAREELFITTKVFTNDLGYDNTLRAFDRSLKELDMEYIDLYLIHWPARGEAGIQVNRDTWRAFEKVYNEGRAKAIGVSNFLPHHLEPLMEKAKIMPMVNQIEHHPGYQQQETVDFCHRHSIVAEAWSPLGTGRVLASQELQEIAGRYNKSVAQLCIRWCLQGGTLPLPKSTNKGRIRENLEVFDFTITQEDMDTINNLPPFAGSGLHPDRVNF